MGSSPVKSSMVRGFRAPAKQVVCFRLPAPFNRQPETCSDNGLRCVACVSAGRSLDRLGSSTFSSPAWRSFSHPDSSIKYLESPGFVSSPYLARSSLWIPAHDERGLSESVFHSLSFLHTIIILKVFLVLTVMTACWALAVNREGHLTILDESESREMVTKEQDDVLPAAKYLYFLENCPCRGLPDVR